MDYQKIWDCYEKGLDFNTKINLNDTVKVNENFYIGKQWEGVKANGLPTPVFNMLKQIVQHQVASICSDNIKVNARTLRASSNDREVDRSCQVVNDELAAIMERISFTTLSREFARNAAVDGSGCLYTYWDYDDEFPRTEVLENTRVIFGNPNNRRVQNQPYIIIHRRERVKDAKEYAEDNGCDPEMVHADTDDANNDMDNNTNDKVTVILYMWKDKKTKTVHAMECVRSGVVRKEWDTELRLYPITWLPWDYVQECYHGQALITGLIPNQEFVNKAYAMAMMSLMMSAFPKIVYDRNRVKNWTNQVGAQIGVNGDVTNIAKILEPAQISPQVSQFIASAIENTQSFTGATAAALGNTRPDNTSAIIALQRASSMPSEITKQNWQNCIKEWAMIQVDFMASYYGKRMVDVPVMDEMGSMGAEVLQFARMPENQMMQTEFDFGSIKKIKLFIGMDVGASAYWSEIASMQTLDNLLQLGQITLVDYLERTPDGYIAKRQELIDKYKAKEAQAQQMAQQMSAPQDVEGDIAEQGIEEEIPTGKGYSAMQRKMNEAI